MNAASLRVAHIGSSRSAGLAREPLERSVGARSGDASDADAAVARAQESYDLGALDWERVDASGTPDQTLACAHAALERLTRSARASTA